MKAGNFNEVSTTLRAGALSNFGRTLKERRIQAGYKRGINFAKKVSEVYPLSSQYLSQIERGYNHPKRGPVTPSRELLDAISAVLNWPRGEMDRELAYAYGDGKEVQTRLGDFLTKMLSKLDGEDLKELIILLNIAHDQLGDAHDHPDGETNWEEEQEALSRRGAA